MLKFIKRYYNYMIFSFFFISMGSWILEILYSLIVRAKFVLPGCISGPWCPIYGTCFILLLLLVNNKDNKIKNIIKIFLIATVVEYAASYISGEIFHNVIWDYSDELLNINGRVCLELSVIFTLMGYAMLYYIEPSIRRIYLSLGYKIKTINIILIGLFITDILVNTFFV